MAKGKVKAKDHEKLDDAHIERVVQLLAEGGTKKAACEILNISYNTTRLNKILDEYNGKKEYQEKRRKQLRGKPFDEHEVRYTILNYLKGDSISELARSQYRTIQGVKKVLAEYNIPERDGSHTYWNPTVIPDDAISKDFNEGELVWSARYNCVAEIRHRLNDETYSIWVFGKHNESAYQPYWELGKLDILQKLGVTKDDFDDFDTRGLFYSIR